MGPPAALPSQDSRRSSTAITRFYCAATSLDSYNHFCLLFLWMFLDRLFLGTPPKKKYGIFWKFFPKGGGSSQFPKLLQINQAIFGMPKSFLGATGKVFPNNPVFFGPSPFFNLQNINLQNLTETAYLQWVIITALSTWIYKIWRRPFPIHLICQTKVSPSTVTYPQ